MGTRALLLWLQAAFPQPADSPLCRESFCASLGGRAQETFQLFTLPSNAGLRLPSSNFTGDWSLGTAPLPSPCKAFLWAPCPSSHLWSLFGWWEQGPVLGVLQPQPEAGIRGTQDQGLFPFSAPVVPAPQTNHSSSHPTLQRIPQLWASHSLNMWQRRKPQRSLCLLLLLWPQPDSKS